MDLAREIVQILSDVHPNLENALIKTKVLLHRLGERTYVDWVNKELNGYQDGDEVPEYRIIYSSVTISVSNGYTRWPNVPAALGHLDRDKRDWYEKNKLRQSISSLESLAQGEGDTLVRVIPPEMWGPLRKNLTQGTFIEHAHCEMTKAQLQGALTQVRSRLLDFVLELEGKIPSDASEEQVREIKKQVDVGGMFSHAMFGPGSNMNVVIGDNNQQYLNFSVVQNDFESLSKFLGSHGVQDIDIAKLKIAISEDGPQPDTQKKRFGPRVQEWIKTMFAKAVDASWQIELGIVGNLLTDALKRYYG